MINTKDTRIKALRPLIAPSEMLAELPISKQASETVHQTRKAIVSRLHSYSNQHNTANTGQIDSRAVVIVGPCSIHDPDAAIVYAKRLSPLIDKYRSTLNIVMRVYFEKPRTTVGWKGLINDPLLDDSFDIDLGLRTARKLLIDINELGVPTASEFLDTIIPQYTADLTSWAAIGARTTESQIHRELASGLSMPIGFKNGTGGSIDIAFDAIAAAAHSHHFMGVTHEGQAAIVNTTGNPDCHIILRGSKSGPNHEKAFIDDCIQTAKARQQTPNIMVDCSHGNSRKDYQQQSHVLKDVCEQMTHNPHIIGVMIESNLEPGNQATPDVFGKSITDACVGWDETETMLELLNQTFASCQSKA